MQSRHLSTRVLVPLYVGVAATALPAATTNWTNNGGGAFGSAGNWDSGVPDDTDTAVFRRGAIPLYPVFLGSFMNPNPEHRTVDRLIIGTNTLTMAGLAGSTLTIDGTDTSETGRGLIIGQTPTDVAVLNNALGSLSALYATLGNAAGSSGTLNVIGGPFNVTGLTPTYDLIVGLFGSGVINVSDGHQVNVGDATVLGLYGGSSGTMTVSGAGSTWNSLGGAVYVGGAGSGTIDLTGGGQLQANSVLIAYETSGSGCVNVTGPNSLLTGNSPFYPSVFVGYRGTGSLNITGGGSVSSVYGYIGTGNPLTGNATVGTVLVDGADSNWTNASSFIIGDNYGTGTLTISNGGRVTSGGGDIGWNNGSVGSDRSVGTVNVTGSTSLWENSSPLTVGYGPLSDGTLNITNGGRVNSGVGVVGYLGGSTGNVTVDGLNSRWHITGALNVGLQSSGTVSVTNSGTVQATVTTIGKGGEARGNGTLVGNVQNSGLVAPGTSVGTLSVTGNYTQTIDGRLHIELASASSFDRLLVTGGASLGGTLEISLLDGFSPSLGQSFVILTCASRLGTFSNVTGMAAGPGRIIRPQYNPANVTLVVGLPSPGDFDLDDDVDGDDLDLFEACASGPGIPLAPGCEDKDFDNDSDADQTDFATVQRCYSGEDIPGDPNCAD